MIVKNINLDSIKTELKQRLVKFIENEEGVTGSEASGNVVRHEKEGNKCVACPKTCANNDKSMACSQCSRKQHFNCAGIKTSEERQIYMSGGEYFVCSKCLLTPGIDLSAGVANAI